MPVPSGGSIVLQCHQETSICTNVSSVQFGVCKDISMYLNYSVFSSEVHVSQFMCVCFSVSSQLASAYVKRRLSVTNFEFGK